MEIIADYPINEDAIKAISELQHDYDFLVIKRFNREGDKNFLKGSIENKCRFCGKSFPHVKFRKIAHAIPEFIGNKCLLAKFECDTCNNYFSEFESELANFMLPFNVIAGTKSKGNNAPKFKSSNQPQINNQNGIISISDFSDQILSDSEYSNLEFKIILPSHIPELIYRCLIKIGLSIIPEKDLENYKNTIVWLMDKSIQSNIKPFMLFSLYPFTISSNEIFCSILVRKNNCTKNVPHSILVLSYGNFAFQTLIPYSAKEKIGIKLQALPFIFPTIFDLNKNHSITRVDEYIELSSTEKVKDKRVSFSIEGKRYTENSMNF
ncbi:HNH endonuclease [Spirosoma jeollabukense]